MGDGWADRRDRWLPVAWSVLLALLLLGPALAPGFVLSYDMVWVPDLALRSDFWGLGSALPRAVPSDAVVAVVDEVVPGMLLQKAVLVGSLVAGGLGAARLAPAGLLPRLLATGLWQWNPFVVERLVLGHWPVLVAYGVLPWVLLLGRRWRLTGRVPPALWALLPLGSLSASAGVATGLALLAVAAGRPRWRRVWMLVGAANAPWVVAGLLHADVSTPDAAGSVAFALSDEGQVPGPLAALTLGGVWNVEVVPSTRLTWLGWVALVVLLALAAVGARAWWRGTSRRDAVALVVLWAAGWGTGVLSWAAPGLLGEVAAVVPGVALVRDGGRLLLLCAPLLVLLVAHGAVVLARLAAPRVPGAPARVVLGGALVLLPVSLLPDAAGGAAGRLDAVAYPASFVEARAVMADAAAAGRVSGDALVLPPTSYRQPAWNGDRKVLDPLGRLLSIDYLADDTLVVDGVVIGGEDPRVPQARAALTEPDPSARAAALGELGVGVVVVDRDASERLGTVEPTVAGDVLLDGDVKVVALRGTNERAAPRWWIAAMTLAWAAFLALWLTCAWTWWSASRRRADQLRRLHP